MKFASHIFGFKPKKRNAKSSNKVEVSAPALNPSSINEIHLSPSIDKHLPQISDLSLSPSIGGRKSHNTSLEADLKEKSIQNTTKFDFLPKINNPRAEKRLKT